MTNPYTYFNDGASPLAQAVIAMLGDLAEGVDESYIKDSNYSFKAEPKINRFTDGSLRGYAISLRTPFRGDTDEYDKQFNIIIYGHRSALDWTVAYFFELDTNGNEIVRWSDVSHAFPQDGIGAVHIKDAVKKVDTRKQSRYIFEHTVHPRDIAVMIDNALNNFWKDRVSSVPAPTPVEVDDDFPISPSPVSPVTA